MTANRETVVIKFGGASLASLEKIRTTVESVVNIASRSPRLVVVVSAMAGETDRLLEMGRSMNRSHAAEALREMDALVATGEKVSAALLALALQDLGIAARSFSAHQLRIETDGRFQRARIRRVDSNTLLQTLDAGSVCVVTGFQGTDKHGNLVTLGRGGSDTSAVAIAIAVGAQVCEFYKDVDGVYTADPRMVPPARKLDRLAYEEMLELTSAGAKVLQMRSVELAMKHSLPLVIRPSFHHGPGTLIKPMHDNLEQPLVSGLAHDLGQAKVSIRGLPDRPDSMTTVLEPLAIDDISIDFITQNTGADGRMSVAFTIDAKLLDTALTSLNRGLESFAKGTVKVEVERDLAKVTAVGIGMRTHAGVAHRVFRCLTRHGIPIHMALSTEIKVSCLVPAADCQRALQELHREFFEQETH